MHINKDEIVCEFCGKPRIAIPPHGSAFERFTSRNPDKGWQYRGCKDPDCDGARYDPGFGDVDMTRAEWEAQMQP